MQTHRVQTLLMGGQACVFYGAAEFSSDTDLAIFANPENLLRLAAALRDLSASCIAVPPFAPEYLERGHAIHFRCQHPEAKDMRVDIMSVMRNVDPFPALWERRTTVSDDEAMYEVMSLPDLVQAKKTQRDKDWPMIRRLVEANYFENQNAPTPQQVLFWLRELRSPELLVKTVQMNRTLASEISRTRPLLEFAMQNDELGLTNALEDEEKKERAADRIYWQPLKTELEALRHARLKT